MLVGVSLGGAKVFEGDFSDTAGQCLGSSSFRLQHGKMYDACLVLFFFATLRDAFL